MKQTILYVTANPSGTQPLALDRECEALEHELRLTADRDQFEFRSKWVVGVDQLMRALNDLSPTILHFSGHGTGGAGAGILLEGSGGAQHVDHRVLAAMIASVTPVPRLVVLNACYSADVANSLCEVVDCVVGMDDEIEDIAAREFTVGFYRALGYRRHSIGTAVRQAKATMTVKQLSGQLVTCHTRNGVNADDLYLVGAPTVREPSQPSTHRYDLFLSHPPANRATANVLYDLLQPDLRVFLAGRSLSPGDRREPAVAAAQRSARATVVLISPQADASWYLGDEWITAITLHRAAPDAHPILPVLLAAGIPLPRCLGDLAPIRALVAGDLAGVAAQLRDRLAALPYVAPSWSPPPLDRRGDHVRLYDRLGQLTDAAFEQIVARAKIDRGSFAPRTAALAQRALDLAQLAALDPTLCQRVSTELDRHGPGR